MAITTRSSVPVALLTAVLTVLSAVDGHAAGRATRGVSWADWSTRDRVPVHARQLSGSDEEYYRNGIHFELYTVDNPEKAELLDIYAADISPTTLFDPRRPTKVAVHGWLSDGLGLIQLRKAFLADSDVNFIAVNWTDIDTIMYPLARYHVPAIGQRVAFLLDYLRLMFGVPLASVHVIGHSLGAHISGLAANYIPGTIDRITGLDPAGPLFRAGPEHSLSATHAAFVDVIHTCANVFGFHDPLGHVDFYPNGGNCFQPGCAVKDMTTGKCSHNRAYYLFRESILLNASLLALPAAWDAAAGDCEEVETSGDFVPMGLHTPRSARGVYCLSTRASEPFGYGAATPIPVFEKPSWAQTAAMWFRFLRMRYTS